MRSTVKLGARILTMLLAVILFVGVFATPASAATRKNVKQYDTYMCIGDSIAAGFYMDGKTGGLYCERVTGAYHDIIANATGAKLNQFGWSAFRAVELRYMLEGKRNEPDNVWLKSFPDLVNNELLDANHDDYIAAIKESSLITVNLGSNDVLSYSMSKTLSLLTKSSDCQIAKMAKDCMKKYGDIGTAFLKLVEKAEKAGKLPVVLASLNPTLMKAVSYFKANFNACMKDIYKLNPKATVVVVGVFNPLRNVSITDNGIIKLAAAVQPTVDLLNTFLKYGCTSHSKYLFASVPKVETWGMSLTNLDLTAFIRKVHPTAAGQSYMADRILAVLPKK